MGNKIKKLLSSILVIALTLTTIAPIKVNAMSKEDKSNGGYEIYPKPHEVNYLDDDFVIRKDVNLVYDSTIDEATKNRMEEVLQSKHKNIITSDKVVSGKTNILVGTYSSNEYAGDYIKEKYNVDESLFEKTDSYYMSAKNGEIAILGKNTDAAFYGITSLKHIFNQMEGSTIRNFEISDYADTPIRGFIEGYYGIPWTNEDRMSLMKFGGEFKMTSYIFAPKDDVYHTSKWRELYPEKELAEIAKMVQVGINTKTKFVWTAHPFMGGFNAANYKEEVKTLIAKFEQLYSVGVRQFGVLGDDVGSLDKDIIIYMMNELSKWGEEKGDVYDWVFCPAGYNASWQGDYSELNAYDAGFPDNVQIFWTGQSVCAPVSQDTLTNFKTHRAPEGTTRRSPLFWLNWPVNDINMKRLMMGKGSLLHTDINVDDLAGVVTNPMQDAEPSKVSIFAIADYAWNVGGFDDDKSWEDSFKYIDSDAPEALHTIAKHTSDPSPNGHGLVLGESEEIKPLLDEFSNKLKNNDSIIEYGTILVNEMDTIAKACDEFIKTSKNARMIEQVKPFANSLKDLVVSIKHFVQTAIDLENKDEDSAVQNFAEGTTTYESSKKHDRPTLNGTQKAQPGSKRLVPFVESVRDALSDEINDLVNGGDRLVLTAQTNIQGIHQGQIQNIVDGKDNTYVWNNQYETVGQYYQVNLSRPTTIYGVDILNGTTSNSDTFGHAKVQYTTDGETWKDINNKTYGPYATNVKITGIEIENVVGVRYICTQTDSGRKWTAMREFKVLTTPQAADTPTFTSEVIRTMDGWSVYSGKESNMLDMDKNTSVHYRVRQGEEPGDTTIAGDYVGVKLSEPIILGKININQGPSEGSGDYFKNAILEYSLDGKTYTEIKQCVNEKDISIDLSNQNIEARYIRLRNNANQPTWIGFREFDVKAKVNHNGKVYTNIEEYKNHPADYLEDNASIVSIENAKLSKGQYIGLKLGRIHELEKIELDATNLENITLQVSKNGYEWTNLEGKTLSENVDARYVRLLNEGNSDVTLNINKFKVLSKEFKKATLIETNMGTIAEGKIENLFDKDRSTGLKYQRSQVKGDYMILDLGQEIDLNELKIVTHDSDKDYIRDGKVYASTDKINWGEEIITIGDQIANTTADDSTINESFPEHEISYNVAKATNIGKRARYIKIDITQPYSHRWTKINEVEVNNGEYIPSVNNPTFDSNVSDTQNGLYEYLVDGNITTMYVPSADKGYLTYSLSENNKVNYIKVMQNAKVISNVKVSAKVISEKKNSPEWIELGTLNKGTNEFVLPVGTTILDIKFEWDGVTPNLVELMFNLVNNIEVNKDSLKTLIDNKEDTSTWTTNSAKVYDNAIKTGIEVLDNSYSSQATVDSAVKEIEKAINSNVLKADNEDLQRLQSEVENAINDKSKYTTITWNNYEKALNNIKEALKDTNNIAKDSVDTLISKLDDAQKSLVYSTVNREESEVLLEDLTIFIETIQNPEKLYTKKSWEELLNSKVELEELLALNNETAQDPTRFEEMNNKVLALKYSLVDITSLLVKIEEFDEIQDSSIYTEESFKAYEKSIEYARGLLVDGTKESIEESVVKIEEAKANLKLNTGREDLEKFIEELKALDSNKYTTNSYEELMNKVLEIEGKDLELMTQQEIKECQDQLLKLKNELVDVSLLRIVVEMAEVFEANKYTLNSYNILKEILTSKEELFVSGTTDEVKEAIDNIYSAVNLLELRVNEKELYEYIKHIKKINEKKYIKESVAIYNKALNRLKSLLDDIKNTSVNDFIEAKNNFESSKNQLEEIKKPSQGNNGNNGGGKKSIN